MSDLFDLRGSRAQVFRDLTDEWSLEFGETHRCLAARLGVHWTSVSRWRSGDREVPDRILFKVARMVRRSLVVGAGGWSLGPIDSAPADLEK